MRLSARGLVKAFRGRRVVDGVSLHIEKGEIVGLLGPNGAGKTTTFYMITGFLRPDEGEIYLDDSPITHLPVHERARKGLCYLPQEPSVFRGLTVEENLLAILEYLPIPEDEMKLRAEDLLKELGIFHLAGSRASTLSGGERRRVEIARALTISPSFILLDEPFAGIDPIAVKDLQRTISRLRERGIGILITDHNVRETLNICDRAYILNEGKVIESGPPERIIFSKEARAVYLGDGFRL